MKTNNNQKKICKNIINTINFWINTNDITSGTHLVDIDEEIFAELEDILTDEEMDELSNKIVDLYWFIREFDNK